MSTLKVQIKGMHCPSCSKLITLDLGDLAGIQSVEINENDQTGRIVFDESMINQKEILKTIANSGYQATAL